MIEDFEPSTQLLAAILAKGTVNISSVARNNQKLVKRQS
jgi:hypothetical protein